MENGLLLLRKSQKCGLRNELLLSHVVHFKQVDAADM